MLLEIAKRLKSVERRLDLLAVRPDAYLAFLARLDAPAHPNARLRKTMQVPQPWGKGGYSPR